MELFGYSWKDIVGMEYTTGALYTPPPLDCPTSTDNGIGHLGVISGLRCLTENVQNGFSILGFVPLPKLRSTVESRRNILATISFRKPALGDGILLSRNQGRVAISVFDASANAVQDVLMSVLESAFWLDVRSVQGEQDVLYFVKESSTKLRDDLENLKRLSGMFNITLNENEKGAGSELRVVNSDVIISITYGIDVELAKHRILRLAHRKAVEFAWLREKQMVEAGLPGQIEWTVEEKVELMTNGEVDGFIGSDLHSIYEFPVLADDPSNIIFRRDTKRKRRKSRRMRPHA